MRFLRIIYFFLAVLPALSPPAQAAEFSGAYLLHICDMDKNGKELVAGGHTACQAYIAGVLDYHHVLQSLNIAPKVDICIPQGTAMNDIHAVLLKYLRENTQHDDFIAAPAVTIALYDAYPCKKK